MPKRISLAPHLTADELHQRYRAAEDPVLRSRYHMLWLLAEGRSANQVADAAGFSAEWVRDIARRYNADGPDAVADGRKRPDAGREPILSADDQAELAAWIDAGGPSDGLVNSVTVARWMSQRLGREVRYQVGHRYLQRLGYSPQRPRPQHAGADLEAQAAFKGGALLQR